MVSGISLSEAILGSLGRVTATSDFSVVAKAGSTRNPCLWNTLTPVANSALSWWKGSASKTLNSSFHFIFHYPNITPDITEILRQVCFALLCPGFQGTSEALRRAAQIEWGKQLCRKLQVEHSQKPNTPYFRNIGSLPVQSLGKDSLRKWGPHRRFASRAAWQPRAAVRGVQVAARSR